MLLIIAIIGFVSCSDDDEKAANDAWTTVQKNAYVSQCTKIASESQCECEFDAISAEWTYTDYQNFQNFGVIDAAKLVSIKANCLL